MLELNDGVSVEGRAKMMFIIDAVDRNAIIPQKLEANQQRVAVENVGVRLPLKTIEVIVTRIDHNERRNFGGAHRKLALKGDWQETYVSSSLDEQELKDVVVALFKINAESLYRFY